jgi:RimJ/RimL family protein N-acetyltransferase
MPPRQDLVSFQTARLNLRPRDMADFDANLAMDLAPDVGLYLYPLGRPSEAELRQKLCRQLAGDWPDRGGVWSVEWREAPGFLGWCGLFPLDGGELIEIAYRYGAAAWGRGVATEAAAAVLELGFETFGFDPIVAVTHPGNAASKQVLRKIGLKSMGLKKAYGLELSYFELAAAAR